MEKKNITYFIGILLIIGLIFYSFTSSRVNPTSQTKNEENSTTTIDKNNNKTEEAEEKELEEETIKAKDGIYITNKHNYQFEYPKDWKIEEIPLQTLESKVNFAVRIESPEGLKIRKYVFKNEEDFKLKKWVSKDMAEKITKQKNKIKVGDKELNQKELEDFIENIVEQPRRDQIEVLSYLQYNSLHHLYLKDKEEKEGKEIIKLTSDNNVMSESFYFSFGDYILNFTYSTKEKEKVEEYREYIEEMIKSLR